MCFNYTLLKVFNIKVRVSTCCGVVFVFFGQLGVIYDSQATNRRGPEGMGVLTGSPPYFLLVAWGSFMTPSCTAMHFFTAIRIRVKDIKYCPQLQLSPFYEKKGQLSVEFSVCRVIGI
jgi:hypothetical protein